MISFVWTPSSFWTPAFPLIPGNGGTETFTLGQARELTRRGILNQIITFRLGEDDGHKYSPDLDFVDYQAPEDMPRIEGDSILATEPLDFKSDRTPFVMMHNPPYVDRTPDFYKKGYGNRKLMTNSHASAKSWAEYLGFDQRNIGVVRPFAHESFGHEPEPKRTDPRTRVLFAGRLTVEKGFYVFLEALHMFAKDQNFEFTVVLAGKQGDEYPIIEKLVRAHPMLNTVPPQSTPQAMAKLMVGYDVLVMPSHSKMWREPFGILSVEAQHAGCRVVASDVGGLPETDCGGLEVFDPENPLALAQAIRRAGKRGRLTATERKKAATQFTVMQSVDQLLDVLGSDVAVYRPK